MEEKTSLKRKVKDFFQLHSFYVSKFLKAFLLSIILGSLCGIMMVLFNYLLILSKFSFSFIPYFITPIIAGILTSLLVKLGKFDRVLGIGSAEFVTEINKSRSKHKHIPKIIAKTVATSWTFGSGLICGKEGPGILIGAEIGHLFSTKLGLDEKDHLFIGASACTGAILKAPISGALYCAELPYHNHLRYQSLLFSIIASTVAYIIFCIFFGFSPFINHNLSYNFDWLFFITILPLLIIFGIITGIVVLIFMGLLRGFSNKIKKSFKSKSILWVAPFIGGIIYSIFLLIIIPYTNINDQPALIGPDVNYLSNYINSISTISLIFLLFAPLFVLIAFYCSIGTMNSAGIIFPLMLFGGLFGGVFGMVFYPSNPELFILLGISAVLGSATNNPIAAIIMIIEMTWIPELFVLAGITTIITYIFSGPSSIIPGQRDVKIKLKPM